MTGFQRRKERHGTAARWASVDPMLAVAEIGVEEDTGLFKIGDGTTPWTGLPYAGGGPGSDTSAIHTGDAAGGVLGGTYPDPGFAVDMATQAALDAHTGDTTDAHDASAISIADAGSFYTGTDVEAALQEIGGGSIGGGSGDFSLLTDGDTEEPELIFADGDVIVTTF